jgi:hypothetical protein
MFLNIVHRKKFSQLKEKDPTGAQVSNVIKLFVFVAAVADKQAGLLICPPRLTFSA